MDKIICIAGPTASGKTALAVELAKELGGEVVSCDSMQIYRSMDVGTAKPTEEEMQGIPHYMLSVADPNENFSVSRYTEMATPIVEDILSRGKWAVVAGGTGLYMDALIRGNSFAPYPETGRRERLEEIADSQGIEILMEELKRIDPDTAERLHLADRKRIIRALEIYQETGITMTEHNRRTQLVPPKFQPIWFGLDFADRQMLYHRIDRRVEIMMGQGLEQEVRSLLASGVSEKATSMQAIGYKEMVDALSGKCSMADAVAQIQQSSRRYAKRQLTWFRRNKQMHWLTRSDENEEILTRARQFVYDNDNGNVLG